ncbi:hypothetical protein KIN34_06170 [Cellulomonas sp. DKR-3]|uniref:Lipoprotein n=1 Tax=Cellulomonas fulva TaxID=2835530 RepID=A0ABS5TXM0_9CELL|nr:hypothetical protein [Cellulomonas fulva]MBT0993871.1 hypothetical protein [Cellulomonas fulva]
MHRHRRAASGVLALLVTATLVGACSSSSDGAADADAAGAAASCEAPQVELSRRTVEAGQAVDVVGTAFLHGCDDAGTAADDAASAARTPVAMTTLEVVWLQDGRRTVLASVDADPDAGTFRIAVTVPADAAAGPATVRVAPAEDVRVTVTGSG